MLSGHLYLSKVKVLFLNSSNPLVTKSYPIKALLHQPLLTRRVAQWLVLLSQYDIGLRTPKVVRSQAISDLLAQFPREKECPLSKEILREVVVRNQARTEP